MPWGPPGGGRRAARAEDPVRVYAFLEIGIGLYCLAVPHLIDLATPLCSYLYRHLYDHFFLFHICLFFLGAVILVPVTALMGATLPYLSRAVVGRGARLGTRLGDLYGANTIGAVGGALAAGFLLIPTLGVAWTNLLAVGMNILVGLGALGLSKGSGAMGDEERAPGPDEGPGGSPRMAWLLLGAFGASGATSLAYQIAWSRSLSMVIGMSTYAFTTIVGAFILGIALGSALFGRLADWTGRPVILLVICLTVAGLAGPVSPWFLGRLPVELLDFYEGVQDSFMNAEGASTGDEGAGFGGFQLRLFGIVFGLMLVPTVFLGGTFPLVARALAGKGMAGREVAPIVGRAYSVNTVGAILGSVVCGFLLIPSPWLGIQGALAISGIPVLVAAILLGLASPGRVSFRLVSTGIVLLLGLGVFLWSPRWDDEVMGAGIYLYGPGYAREARITGSTPLEVIRKRGSLVFHREGVSTTVQVKESSVDRGSRKSLVLLVNGKPEATTLGDMRTQALLGHLAPVFHDRPESGLVIGLGGGLTLASMAASELSSIDCLEISDAVVEAASRSWDGRSFASATGHVLDRDEVRLILGDGRTHVAFTDSRYDVVSSQPSNPWIAGVANLFTVEFFRMVHDRLEEGGLFCQWVQAYRMSVSDFRMIVRTFLEAFPEAYLWKTQTVENVASGDFLLLGARGAFTPSSGRLEAAMKRGRVASDLAAVGIHGPLDLMDGFVLGPRELAAYGGKGPLNTDDNAHLEFSSPRSFYLNGAAIGILESLLEYRGSRPGWFQVGGDAEGGRVRFESMTRVFGSIVAWGKRESSIHRAIALSEEALRIDPTRPGLEDHLIRLLSVRGQFHAGKMQYDLAIADFERVLAMRPAHPETLLKMGEIYGLKGMFTRARMMFLRVIDSKGTVESFLVADAHVNLAGLYLEFGQLPEAWAQLDLALAMEPDHSHAWAVKGQILSSDKGRLKEAIEALGRAVQGGATSVDVFNLWARLLYEDGRIDAAIRAFETSLELDEEQERVHHDLGRLYFEKREFDEALGHVERSEELGFHVDDQFYRNLRKAAGR